MQYDSTKVRNLITLDTLNFEVVSYKLDHVKTISSYFTVSNSTKMYTNGTKPYVLSVKGYFPKTKGNSVVSTLEGLLTSSTNLTFSISNMTFSNAVLSKYSFKEQTSSMYQECELTFMSVDTITEVADDE